MAYIFEYSDKNLDDLKDEISFILDKAVELNARKQVPKLWVLKDKLDGSKRASDYILEKRRKRYKKYGVLMWLVGLIFLMLSVVGSTIIKDLLYYGIFLMVVGTIYLLPRHRTIKKSTRRAYKIFEKLKNSNMILTGSKLYFDNSGIDLSEKESILNYCDIDMVYITPNIYLIVYGDRIILLNKLDLLIGSNEDFENHLFEVIGDKIFLIDQYEWRNHAN